MNPRHRLLALAALGFIAFSLVFAWLRQPPAPAVAPAVAQPCRILGYEFAIECGTLTVPVFHGRGGTEQRTLRWYRIPARARYPAPDPILWITETGVDAPERAAWLADTLMRARNTRDLVWLEARGAPSASESGCVPPGPATMEARINPLADATTSARCRAAWANWGGAANLDARTRADDLALLLRTLGIRQVNVLAEGAGARVALAWTRLEPHVVRTLTLDSPPPLNGNTLGIRAGRAARALAVALDHCARQPECNWRYPDPAGDLAVLRTRLPATLALPHPQSGKVESVHLDDGMLALMLERILYSPVRASALPAALHAAAVGDWRPLLGLAALGWPRRDTAFAWEPWLADACMEGSRLGPPPAEPLAAWFFRAQAGQLATACGGIVPYTPLARKAVAWPVPTLALVGAVDPLGDDAPVGTVAVTVPGAGHGVLAHGCARDVLFHFVRAGSRREGLQVQCLEQVPYPVPFIVESGEVIPQGTAISPGSATP